MSEIQPYSVSPLPPTYRDAALSGRPVEGLNGCLGGIVWIVGCVIGYIILSRIDTSGLKKEHVAVRIIVWALPLVASAFLLSKIDDKQREVNRAKIDAENDRLRNEQRQRDEGSARDEARGVEQSLRNIIRDAKQKVEAFEHSVAQTNECLAAAHREFSQNAYAPYWDAVEGAVQHLARAKAAVDSTSELTTNYYKLLSGREHTFPVFPISQDRFTNAVAAAEAVRTTLRLGLTNFQFATIWEQRRTQQAISSGFQTLGDAVQQIESSVSSSIRSLSNSLSDSVARKVVEEIHRRRVAGT